jgi:pimeloyl-ACP methyl ester carboxylesterase
MTSELAARRFADTASVSIRRAPSAPAGTLVMLHGLGGCMSQFDPILRRLHCPDHDLIRVDLRGHGATRVTGNPASFTFAQFALDVVTLLGRSARARPVTGVGISMGAGVLASIQLRHHGLFDQLVLVRPTWEDQPSPAHLVPFQDIAVLLGSHEPDTGAAIFRSSPAYQQIRRQSAYAASSLLEQFTAPGARTRRVRLARMPASTPFPSLAHLQAVTAPATVVATAGDPLHPVAIARNWASHLPQARCELIPAKTARDQRYARELAGLVSQALAAVG